MEEIKLKNESGNYDKILYEKLRSFRGKRCKLILKDGDEAIGSLNHVGIGLEEKPYISFDMGDYKIVAQYNLDFDNISDVVSAE
jgi:hypothetical protein